LNQQTIFYLIRSSFSFDLHNNFFIQIDGHFLPFILSFQETYALVHAPFLFVRFAPFLYVHVAPFLSLLIFQILIHLLFYWDSMSLFHSSRAYKFVLEHKRQISMAIGVSSRKISLRKILSILLLYSIG